MCPNDVKCAGFEKKHYCEKLHINVRTLTKYHWNPFHTHCKELIHLVFNCICCISTYCEFYVNFM